MNRTDQGAAARTEDATCTGPLPAGALMPGSHRHCSGPLPLRQKGAPLPDIREQTGRGRVSRSLRFFAVRVKTALRSDSSLTLAARPEARGSVPRVEYDFRTVTGAGARSTRRRAWTVTSRACWLPSSTRSCPRPLSVHLDAPSVGILVVLTAIATRLALRLLTVEQIAQLRVGRPFCSRRVVFECQRE